MRSKYALPSDVRDWRYQWAVDDLKTSPSQSKIQPISYRPFDRRFIYFTGRSRGFVGWPVEKLMRHFVLGANIGLATARSNKNPVPDHFFITDVMMETKFAESSTQAAVFPLYLYPSEQDLEKGRRINFQPKLFQRLQQLATHPKRGLPSELEILTTSTACCTALLTGTSFSQFLKMDFPRIPWPYTPDEFWDASDKGGKLRRLHL